MQDGWLKLFRKTRHNKVFLHDLKAWHVFECLMLLSDYKTGSWRGGRIMLANFSQINENTIKDVLRRLQQQRMITIKSTNRYSIITICNWSKYQGADTKPVTTPITNQSPTNHHYIKKLEAKASSKNKERDLILVNEKPPNQQRASRNTVQAIREKLASKGIIKRVNLKETTK